MTDKEGLQDMDTSEKHALPGEDVPRQAPVKTTHSNDGLRDVSQNEGVPRQASDKTVQDNDSSLDMYGEITLLLSSSHGDLRFARPERYPSAAGMTSVILAGSECAEAAPDYPLVFAQQKGRRSVHAVTGYSAGENLFVGENGEWRRDTYVPAYVRRYPFIVIEDPEVQKFMLAADLSSDVIGKEEGDPLFENGEPSETAKNALAFCTSYHHELVEAEKLIDQIADLGILVERNADLILPDESKHQITGFQIVDEEKFKDLSGVDFLSLRRSNALPLIYAHLISMRNWRKLIDR